MPVVGRYSAIIAVLTSDVVVIPGCRKHISRPASPANMEITLRIENVGSTSWKPLRSSLGHMRDDDDDDDDDDLSICS